MDVTTPVRTGSNGHCRQCAKPLPPRTARAHHFCPGAKCRAAWHRAEKQRRLNEALRLVETFWLAGEAIHDRLTRISAELVAAGAERRT